LTPLYNRDGT